MRDLVHTNLFLDTRFHRLGGRNFLITLSNAFATSARIFLLCSEEEI